DIVADIPPYGEYNPGDLVADNLAAGLLVQEPPQFSDIIQDIACDQWGLYKDVFDSHEILYARVNSLRQPLETFDRIGVYVMPHKDVWMAGDSLVDVRTVGTHEMPIHALWNGIAGSLPLLQVRGRTEPDDPNPIVIWPGEYDMIVDVNRNSIYDPGTDIIDGGTQPGFVVPGKPPKVRFAASADVDFLSVYPNATKIWGVLVDSLGNFYEDIPVSFQIVYGPGALSADTSRTSANGQAFSNFTGATFGRGTLVRLDTIVDGELYSQYVLIFRKIPYAHNQGILIGG
ncbi:hypothetical protein JW992_02060, partial [candidate division KSB1 bacterium]|nr:hypothetical protein [candidate division KSB1 bacterium]